MSLYLPLIFLLSISTSLQMSGRGIFSIYNEDNKLCAQAQNSSSVITATCDERDEFQKFRWVSPTQLLSMALKLCLGVLAKDDEAAVTLESCNRTNELQWWECRNETLATHGKDLFLNYGKGKGKKIRLSKVSSKGSRWKIHGSAETCVLGAMRVSTDIPSIFLDIYTLGGNAFGAPCVFPFKHQGKWYAECIPRRDDTDSLWCATSSDFDKDQLFGNCPLKGLTSDLGINAKLWIGLYNALDSGWKWTGGSPFRYLNWAPEPDDELWIGLNDFRVQMYFEWSDGTPVTYTKWLPGEPAHTWNKADCILMKGQDGSWADSACERKFGYICKRKPLAEEPGEAEVTYPGCQKLPTTFPEAKKVCEENKGYLATVRDRYEQAFLTSITGFKPEKYFWIGLSDVEEQGTFRWASGDPVTFTHWNVGMPGGESGCVAMATGSSAGLWDILDCEETNTFLCKQLVEGVTPPPPPPTTSPLLFCPEGWQSTSQSSFCFKIFQGGREKMQTWFEARDFCRTIGGDLACIHSEEEQNLIARLERDYIHYSFWMGLSALDSDAGFTWSDGSPVNFEKWSHGEPNNYDGNEKCGVFTGYLNMNWNDLFCDHMLDFVCQIKKDYEYVVGEDNWITYKHKEYYFSKEAMSMERARGFCKKNGGDLVVIESETEKKFLWKYVFHKDWGNNFYIGLSVSLDRTFQWMDGTPVNYVAWAPNEPNFANNDENCVVMYTHTGTWNDINCGSVELFICERLNNTVRPTVAPTSPPPKGGCTEDWLLFDNKCFKVFGFNENDTLTWHAARNNCIDFGGNLATISKKEEQAFLMSLLKNAATDAWVGLNDINQEHTYLWTDGSPVDYTNWAKGSRSYYSMDDCVFLMKNPIEQAGKWKDEGCKASKSYICQKSSDPKLLHSQPTVPVFGFNNYGDDRYEVINYKMSWEKAEKNCRDQSAELASILDPYAESFLWLQILKYGEPVWIGLNSNMSGGQYVWSDRRRSRYLNWASGEPNKNKACVYLDLDGFWKTASCNETFLSLCKQSNELIPSEPPQLPGKCPEPKRGRSWIPFRGHCYYVHTTSEESWPDASMMCIQMGEWIWMDRSAVEYVNWEKGEPTVLFDEHCVDMDVSSGTWRTYYCSVDQNFICKIPKIAEVEPTHDSPVNNASINKAAASSSGGLGGMIFILIFLLLAGTGLTLYCFYKRRRDRQMFTAGFDNAIYRGDLGTHESNCLVTNIEENEQETI
ncbi:hypothetical protein DUI87_18106 [Hirundo rustica rustica]|uniref:Macrophage mannose receptor 1 n=1 Tax=Hirundo rustica rustica TaxID=333673 RepID=A0A3M0K109_HIRRU|nr:hypothetical protein DUI87_18106 [Hirundo rustica rustica]